MSTQTTFIYQGKDVLAIMSECAINRNKAVEDLIVKYFNLTDTEAPKSILEFGAGTGEFINRLRRFSHLTTFAVEIDETYLAKLAGLHRAYKSLSDIPQTVDYIFTIDVLEHIEDDEEILRALYSSLNPGGKLLIYVPARPELYSKFDRSIGHYRRYRLDEVRDKVRRAGFQVRVSRYDDFLGYFAAVFNKMTSDGSLNARAVKLYDKIFVPFTRMIESVVRPPIGKNVLLVAEKNRN